MRVRQSFLGLPLQFTLLAVNSILTCDLHLECTVPHLVGSCLFQMIFLEFYNQAGESALGRLDTRFGDSLGL